MIHSKLPRKILLSTETFLSTFNVKQIQIDFLVVQYNKNANFDSDENGCHCY